MVIGHGPEFSPIMIVSDHPTADEAKIGKALSGATGKMVAGFLKQNEWSLERCYKTTYIKEQMIGYGSKDKKRSEEVLKDMLAKRNWGEILNEEIRDIKPNIILALGELPLNYLANEKSVHNFRGSILPINPLVSDRNNLRVVSTLHPRDIFINQTASVYVSIDYKKAVKHYNNTEPYKEPGNLWICKTTSSLIEWWKRARYGEFLVFDIETLYNFVTCIGFSVDGEEALSIPMLDPAIPGIEKLCLYRKVNEILKSRIPKVNQNIKYDWTIEQKFGFEVNNIIGDTMLMAHTLYPELEKKLAFLASIYTEIPFYKDEGKEYDPRLHDFSRMLFYNAKDCIATWQVWKAQQQDAEDLKVKHFYFNYVQPLFFHYKKLDDTGIRVDELVRQELEEKYSKIYFEHTTKLKLVYGKELNVNSPKQVAEFIYDFLQCPKHYHTNPKGEQVLSTAEEVIEEIYLNEISDEPRKILLREVLMLRKIDKVLQFVQTPYSMFDGRMRTTSKLQGTENGRTSMGEAIGWYYSLEKGKPKRGKIGTSFQTIPKHGFKFEGERYGHDIRRMFIPSKGKIFIDADGSNAEGHVVCVLAEDWETLNYMKAGNDLHKLTASWILMKPVELIKKPSDERDLGKTARHAGNLGQGSGGLSILIHKPRTFCKIVMERFHAKAPKVQEVFHWSVKNELRNRRLLINPYERRRDFFDKITDHTDKAAFSFLPQSTVGDHYKLASLRIAKKAPYSDQLFEAHDGLMWEIAIDKKEDFIPIIHTEMTEPINFKKCTLSRDYDLVIPIEIGCSEPNGNWKEMKDITDSEVKEIISKSKRILV